MHVCTIIQDFIVLKCKQLELFDAPPYVAEILYSNFDGGDEGILFRYITWVKSLTEREYYCRSEKNMIKHAKPIHDQHIAELLDIEDPKFYWIDGELC